MQQRIDVSFHGTTIAVQPCRDVGNRGRFSFDCLE